MNKKVTQDLARQDTQRIVSQHLQVVNNAPSYGAETCSRINTFLNLSGALVTVDTEFMGSFEVKTVIQMGKLWVKCYCISPDGNHHVIKVPWGTRFNLFLGMA